MDQVKLVEDLRSRPLIGKCIDLIPYDEAWCEEVVRLRNLPEVRRSMNLVEPPSVTAQRAWGAEYVGRRNDVFWMILNKAGQLCGCNRIYDIQSDVLEKGSQIVDPRFARTCPVALEADFIAINLAFELFGVKRVIYRTRSDNIMVQSMNTRYGFTQTTVEVVAGVAFNVYELRQEHFNNDPLQKVINHWGRRYNILTLLQSGLSRCSVAIFLRTLIRLGSRHPRSRRSCGASWSTRWPWRLASFMPGVHKTIGSTGENTTQSDNDINGDWGYAKKTNMLNKLCAPIVGLQAAAGAYKIIAH